MISRVVRKLKNTVAGKLRRFIRHFYDCFSSSITNRIAFAAMSLAVMTVLIIGIVSYTVMYSTISQNVHEILEHHAMMVEQKLESSMNSISSDMTNLSANKLITNALVDSQGRELYLLPFIKSYSLSEQIPAVLTLCDFQGNPIASNQRATPSPYRNEALLKQVIDMEKPYAEIKEDARVMKLLVAYPVFYGATGRAEGILVMETGINDILEKTRTIIKSHEIKNVRLRLGSKPIWSNNGTADKKPAFTVIKKPHLKAPLESLDLQVEVGEYKSMPIGWLALMYSAAVVLILAFTVWASRLIARHLTTRIVTLSNTARLIAESGSLDLNVEVKGNDEVEGLALAFKQMLDRLRSSHEILEQLVEERTRELATVNEELKKEIAERKQMEEAVIRARNLESLGFIAGGIAHDFNNLMTIILGYASLAKMSVKPEDRIFGLLTQSEDACIKAKELTAKLLTFSKGGEPIMKTTTFINDFLKDSADFALRGSNIRYEFSIPDDLYPVEVDEGQMSQVIHNLVINAREAMPDGGVVKISAENITVRPEDHLPLQEGKYIRISIEDHGAGIPEEHLQRIFDPYFTTKPMGVQKGMGLGLSICYSIIKKHNGHITVKSSVGVGTTFNVYLPASLEGIPTKEDMKIMPDK